jgi:hypothetical protein
MREKTRGRSLLGLELGIQELGAKSFIEGRLPLLEGGRMPNDCDPPGSNSELVMKELGGAAGCSRPSVGDGIFLWRRRPRGVAKTDSTSKGRGIVWLLPATKKICACDFRTTTRALERLSLDF